MKASLKAIILAGSFAAASAAYATPITLTGNFIKTAVSDFGTLGSDGNAQPGLQHDPTGTGTFDPTHDYISPGTPHDGFSLHAAEFGFSSNDNNFGSDFGSGSPTLLTGAAANGFDHAASWSGGNSFVTVQNSYFFNNGDERVVVKTTITALKNITNLAFARSVDPDPDNYPGGSASTNNQRGNSLFGIDDFVGSAGTISGLTLALVNVDAAGFAHTTQINTSCCSNIDPYDVLAHTGGDAGLMNTGDYGLNLAYNIGALASGQAITLTYEYAVGDAIGTVGGTGGVPEPATWAMMIAGFAAVGAVARRRKQPAALLGTA